MLAEDRGGYNEYRVTLVSEKNCFKPDFKISYPIKTGGEVMVYYFITSKINSVFIYKKYVFIAP